MANRDKFQKRIRSRLSVRYMLRTHSKST